MGYRASQLNLPFEPCERVFILHSHGLHGHPRTELEILGFIHLAHAARADRSYNAIPSGEGLPGVQRPGESGRAHPLPAKQADVEQSAAFVAVAKHRQCFVTQFAISIGNLEHEQFAAGGGLF